MELWEGKKTQPLLLLSNPAEGQASTLTLTEPVTGGLCPPRLFVCCNVCVGGVSSVNVGNATVCGKCENQFGEVGVCI